MIFLLSLVSFSICFVGFPVLISRFKRARIVGKNMNNNVHEKIPEMGGIIIIIGGVKSDEIIQSVYSSVELFKISDNKKIYR